jgi:hypothetical protein
MVTGSKADSSRRRSETSACYACNDTLGLVVPRLKPCPDENQRCQRDLPR